MAFRSGFAGSRNGAGGASADISFSQRGFKLLKMGGQVVAQAMNKRKKLTSGERRTLAHATIVFALMAWQAAGDALSERVPDLPVLDESDEEYKADDLLTLHLKKRIESCGDADEFERMAGFALTISQHVQSETWSALWDEVPTFLGLEVRGRVSRG